MTTVRLELDTPKGGTKRQPPTASPRGRSAERHVRLTFWCRFGNTELRQRFGAKAAPAASASDAVYKTVEGAVCRAAASRIRLATGLDQSDWRHLFQICRASQGAACSSLTHRRPKTCVPSVSRHNVSLSPHAPLLRSTRRSFFTFDSARLWPLRAAMRS